MMDPEKEDEMKYMEGMFTADLKFMHRMIKRAKKKLIKEFKKMLREEFYNSSYDRRCLIDNICERIDEIWEGQLK